MFTSQGGALYIPDHGQYVIALLESQGIDWDFAESMAAMFFQGLGMSAKEAARIAAVPIPIATTHPERENEKGVLAKAPKKAHSPLTQSHR